MNVLGMARRTLFSSQVQATRSHKVTQRELRGTALEFKDLHPGPNCSKRQNHQGLWEQAAGLRPESQFRRSGLGSQPLLWERAPRCCCSAVWGHTGGTMCCGDKEPGER